MHIDSKHIESLVMKYQARLTILLVYAETLHFHNDHELHEEIGYCLGAIAICHNILNRK